MYVVCDQDLPQFKYLKHGCRIVVGNAVAFQNILCCCYFPCQPACYEGCVDGQHSRCMSRRTTTTSYNNRDNWIIPVCASLCKHTLHMLQGTVQCKQTREVMPIITNQTQLIQLPRPQSTDNVQFCLHAGICATAPNRSSNVVASIRYSKVHMDNTPTDHDVQITVCYNCEQLFLSWAAHRNKETGKQIERR